jgi:hypothetical protein
MFIVYCKLYDYWRKTGEAVGIRRFCRHQILDKEVSILLSRIPFISYEGFWPFHLLEAEGLSQMPYVNPYWDGKARGEILKNDPPDILMEPFPEVFHKSERDTTSPAKRIVIQVHSGKKGFNSKFISRHWLRRLLECLETLPCEMVLLGTESRYWNRRACCSRKNGNSGNLLGKTGFEEWLRELLAADCLITPEGFASFFACSQKIPTMAFYQFESILAHIHPKWRDFSNFGPFRPAPLAGRLIRKMERYFPVFYELEPAISPKEAALFVVDAIGGKRSVES